MIITNRNIGIDFDTIPIDAFWNTGEEKENKMHRIHSYPAKFPAFITTKALEYAELRGVEVNLIADVFCGCGTTAFEARRNEKDYWGCDINPVATLIAKTKSRSYSERTLKKYYRTIINHFNSSNVEKNDSYAINERIKYWFFDEQIHDLLRLRSAILISVPSRSHYLNFFLCAFSNILKPASRWLTKSIKPQIDPEKKPASVLDAFKEQYDIMVKANLGNNNVNGTNIEIENCNFLERRITRPFADLIVTSPPYVTSYEYADLHQLSTLWLEYSEDYKLLREGSIGSLYHNSNFKEDSKKLNNTGSRIVFNLYNVDKGKAKSAAKYFIDMQLVARKTYRMLNRNGLALFVIGNTEYKSIRIDNAKHLVESMIASGYVDIDVVRRKISTKTLTPYRDEKGKFTTNKNSRKVYSEEFIIIGRKYNE